MHQFNLAAKDTSLRTKVFDEIEKAILDGAYKAGDSLTELKLSQELGVSRTPVREALRQLELEGLVKTTHNKGAIVVGVSEKDIEDIYTIRIRIEGLAARLAAENITDEELAMLNEIVELQEFYTQKRNAIQVWQLDTKFHQLIFDSCRSRPLRHTLLNFHHYIQHAREVSFKNFDRVLLAASEHRAIFEALMNHDAQSAEELMSTHVSHARENFLSNVRQDLDFTN